jgi:hypothetical protein
MSADLRARIDAAIAPLRGWTTPDKAARLAELVVETRADRSVEIGVFGGRGTVAMALAHQFTRTGYVAAIDPWDVAASLEGDNDPTNDDWWSGIDYDDVYEEFLRAIVQHGLARHCRIMRERSETARRLFADHDVAVLHQDGNHSERVSSAEVRAWAPTIAPGGYWVADDTDWPTTAPAQALLLGSGFTLLEDHGTWRVYRKS